MKALHVGTRDAYIPSASGCDVDIMSVMVLAKAELQLYCSVLDVHRTKM